MADEPQKTGTDILDVDPFELDDEAKQERDEYLSLKDKPETELSEEEKTRLSELKDKSKKVTSNRISILVKKAREAEERYGRVSSEAESLRQELAELKEQVNKPKEPTVFKRETVEAGGKSWYTNDTLQRMVDSKEITLEEANSHAEERNNELAADKAYKRIKSEQERETTERTKQEELRTILQQHPEFDRNHPNYNPSDPLYIEFIGLLNDGYKSYTKALSKAEKIVGVGKAKPDLSEQFNVGSSSAAASTKDTVQLSEAEKDMALTTFYRAGNMINPKTNKPYTQAEAIEKALNAKKRRLKDLKESRVINY